MSDIPIVGDDFDEVVIDVLTLATLKKSIEEAGRLAQLANGVGIQLVKALSTATQVGDSVRETEANINDLLKSAAAVSGVKQEDFLGFDLERGTIRVKKALVN